MAQVKKLDGKRRAVFPEGFVAGDSFLEEVSGDQVTYRLIQPAEVPLAKVGKRQGRSFVKAPLDKKAIADAVRRERDAR